MKRVGPSAALLGKSREEKYSIVGLTHSDGLIQDHLSRLLKGVWPGEFKQLKKAFDRGNWACDKWVEDSYEEGVFFNRVSLWKATARMHRDRKDYLCAILCSGAFTGGEAVLPDLGLKFR